MATIRITLDSTTVGNGVSNDFTLQIPQGIPSKDYEVAVEAIAFSFSWFNISSAIGNNQIGYKTTSGGSTTFITIPDGEFGISDINTILQQGIAAHGGTPANIILAANGSTLTMEVTLTGGYCLDLTSGSLWQMLGYNSGVVITTQGITYSPNEPNVTPVNTVLFHCSLVNSAWYNNAQSDVIHSYTPSGNTAPGDVIAITPNLPTYQAISPDAIYNIRMYVTDNLLNPLNLEGQPVTYSLLLRKIDRTQDLMARLLTKLGA